MNYQGQALSVSSSDGIAELQFDLKGESVNKFNELTLGELREAVRQLNEAPGISGLLLTSAKNVFVVGADITEFTPWFDVPSEEFTRHIVGIHEVFSALEDLPFPTVAAINGFALGGGFEVTLACDYRVMSTKAQVGLPEVKLGLFPGWGGTIRLPRLIGLDNAVEWIGLGKQHRPADALKIGAVDAVVEPELLADAARNIIRQCNEGALDYGSKRQEKIDPIRLNEVERMMVFSTAEAYVAAKAGPHYPAPGIALKAMKKHVTLPRDEASEIEAAAFAEVFQTDAARSLVGLFLNDQILKRDARKYSKQARPVESAAVLGAGIMGGGIAYQSGYKGIPIVMKDIDQGAIDLGLGEASKLLARRVERGQLKPSLMGEVLNRINPTLDYDEVKHADLVVEAVVENEGIKKSVLKELEGVVREDAVIATNTSTISIDTLASALENKDRFCGMHFFNPVHVMPLVEVIRGKDTSDETLATTVEFARKIGKNPIVVNDCPGFLVNRVLFPYLNAFELLVRDGADIRQIDKSMERFGWPMGPAYLLDVVGIDTAHHAAAVLAEAYPDRMQPGFRTSATMMYESGRLGQKSGSGYYRYERDKKGKLQKVADDEALELLGQIVSASDDFGEDEIVARMMIPMCIETARCVEENIVDSPVAADMGLIWGIGFPPFRGGALRYIDSLGVDAFCDLADRYASLGGAYQVTDGLRAMAAEGRQFF
jgi:3-hydroxyacyl-CoA dehydrogenase/enoyl-CoA hydratase/3-hydroxybutyryl-CoA epimerase/enoyl-CoA isomerase